MYHTMSCHCIIMVILIIILLLIIYYALTEQVSCKLPNNEHTYVHNTVLCGSPWPFWLKLRRQPISLAVGGGTLAAPQGRLARFSRFA